MFIGNNKFNIISFNICIRFMSLRTILIDIVLCGVEIFQITISKFSMQNGNSRKTLGTDMCRKCILR